MDLGYLEVVTEKGVLIEVRYGGVHVGWIRRSADQARYEYYHGVLNDFAYAYSNSSLDELKRVLGARMGRSPLSSTGLMV
ncbi:MULTISPECIES: hypothetical protein [unclassified Lysobacter]|uniref:hypothetical protein n=1 Tax=unclassified Lysobacter TaxID=2635362 RepID=UPI0006F716E1|nr:MULTISPECIES: hypothetical protein [unclassified Lysobacter]KRA20555.1 hypothetical protein ASD69_04305 [Lysobacter sp. Root604]KRD39576.1 hypothetical protein ASE35_04340 [Lysobacter sp. Root916]KRD79542.1 hypothetical protein ASE43_01100 [Lysobacter sp. Root983]